MMKFFRKHMKELLAVFMALLLVVWLGGSALTDALRGNYDPGDMKKGVIYGQPVVLNDMRPVVQ